MTNSPARDRKGFVLLAVLGVVVLLALGAYQFSELMLAEDRAAERSVRVAQARAAADSGVQYALALLADPANLQTLTGGNPYDAASAFQNVTVAASDDLRAQARFSIVAAGEGDVGGTVGTANFRYGVADEAARINLNTLLSVDSTGEVGKALLLKLPNMTEEVANAILDWIDADDEPRAGGAESSSYAGGQPGYRAKNGPLDTLEELLLVQGVTPQLLFGNDRNRNGTLDAGEDSSGGLDRGWAAYLTLYSRESNTAADGSTRTFANGSDLKTLQADLKAAGVADDVANFVLAYRAFGPASPPPMGAQPAPADRLAQAVETAVGGATPPRVSLSSLFDLVDAQVVIQQASQGGRGMPPQPALVARSPLQSSDAEKLREVLPVLFDKLTTRQQAEIPGRINVLTAPQVVLSALPGLDEAQLQTLLDKRPTSSGEDPTTPVYQTPAWLLCEANLPASVCRTLERYVTCRTQVYRVQSLGTFEGGGPAARVEAVIDVNGGAPRVVFYRDLGELGRGFE